MHIYYLIVTRLSKLSVGRLAENISPDCGTSHQKLARTGPSAGLTIEGPLLNKARTQALKKQCVLLVLRSPGPGADLVELMYVG